MRGGLRFDAASLAAGVVTAALGVYVLLESEETVDLSFGWAAVAVTAALGVVLILTGLAPAREDRHD